MATITSPSVRAHRTTAPVRLTVRGRRVLLAAAVLLATVAALLASSRGAAAASQGPQVTTVVVAPGQSLWQIAEQIAPQTDPRATIYRIEQLNGMRDAHVEAGTLLVVPAATR